MNLKLDVKSVPSLRSLRDKPGALLGAAGAAAALILVLLYFQLLYPVQSGRGDTLRQLSGAQEDRDRLMAMPVPEKVTEEQLREVKASLPFEREMDTLLDQVAELATVSGIELRQMELRQAADDEDNLLEQVATSGTEVLQESGESAALAGSPADAGAPVQSLVYTLEAQGEYDQLVHFMELLVKLDRILHIGTWELSPNSDPELAGQAVEAGIVDETELDEGFALTAEITLHYSQFYGKKLNPAAELEASQ